MHRYRSMWMLLPVIALFLVHAWVYVDFFIDDAYISLRYVTQWLAGNGLVYNIGEQVEGYSNFSWVVLLGVSGALGLDLVVSAQLLGLGFSIATLVLVHRFAQQRLQLPLLSPLLLALSVPIAAWSTAGLESPLVMFLVFAGVALFQREEERGRGWSSSVFWGLLALTRPEGLVFGGTALVWRIARLRRTRQRPQRDDVVRLAVFATFVLPFLVWRLAYYGRPLPNTVYAKSTGFNLRTFLEGGHYVHASFEILGGAFVVGLLVLVAITARHRHPFVPFFSFSVAAYLLVVVVAGGDWMPAQRFVANVLPLLVVVMHAGALELVRLLSLVLPGPVAWSPLILHLAFVVTIALSFRFVEPGIPDDHRRSEPYPWVSHLQDHVDAGDTIAVLDAGLVAHELPLDVRIIDMVGLTNSHIAHRPPRFPGGLWGRGDAWGRWDVDHVLENNPRFVQMHLHEVDEDGVRHTGFTGTTLLANDRRFRERYESTELRGLFERVADDDGSTFGEG